jgi:hypothetical protein
MPPIASEDQWLVTTPQSVSSTLPVICQINRHVGLFSQGS